MARLDLNYVNRLISRHLAHEGGGKVVSPTHRPPLPPRKYSWYSFLLEAEATPGLMFGYLAELQRILPSGVIGWLQSGCIFFFFVYYFILAYVT